MRLNEKCKYDNFDYCYAKSNKEQDNDVLCLNKLGQLEDILEKYAIYDLKQLDQRLDESVRDFTYLGYGKRKVKDYYDLEQELGIDLIILFKALKHFWKFDSGKKVCVHYPFLRKNENCKKYELVFNQHAFGDTGISDAHIFYDSVYLKDYGKTWALTKKELKNETISLYIFININLTNSWNIIMYTNIKFLHIW